ncbi:MAG: hypothetical protein E7Z91_04280 [Cyanobacteria bacterium SIG30]|nr:hypothetical protein [Cyanobacteria bacterium SIG30]
MAIGAFDRLDVALVKKYNSLKVDNPIIGNSMVDPNKMYEAMNDYALMHRSMLDIQAKLRSTCKDAIAPGIQYHKTKQLKNRTNPAT